MEDVILPHTSLPADLLYSRLVLLHKMVGLLSPRVCSAFLLVIFQSRRWNGINGMGVKTEKDSWVLCIETGKRITLFPSPSQVEESPDSILNSLETVASAAVRWHSGKVGIMCHYRLWQCQQEEGSFCSSVYGVGWIEMLAAGLLFIVIHNT